MSRIRGKAPSWLYSFVDLAFLLLLALSQLDLNLDPIETVELGEISIPRIATAIAQPLDSTAPERWQLRVHPPEEGEGGPFALVPVGGSGADQRLGVEALRTRLAALRASPDRKPLLAPHETSHSRDLLTAVALLEELWPSRRNVAIDPEGPPEVENLPVVSAGP
jgi:hypothetical protein